MKTAKRSRKARTSVRAFVAKWRNLLGYFPKTVQNTNSKCGKDIFVWNIPAILTCVGSTPICRAWCYAAATEEFRKNTLPLYMRNWEFSKTSEFSQALIKDMPVNGTVRVHGDGDFYSVEYAQKWLEIMTSRPDVTFYAYTRSWRVSAILPVLQAMQALPNVQLFASTDEDIRTPTPAGWRVAAMEGAAIQPRVICPEQTKKKSDCSACRYCPAGKRGDVQFLKHGYDGSAKPERMATVALAIANGVFTLE